MNKCIITGNMANDPEAFTTNNGIARSQFRVAVRRKFKNQNGEHEADFFNVVAWRGAADYSNKYLKKGKRVAVEGSMQMRTYTDKNNAPQRVWELIADSVEILDKIEKSEPRETDDFMEVDDEGLPF